MYYYYMWSYLRTYDVMYKRNLDQLPNAVAYPKFAVKRWSGRNRVSLIPGNRFRLAVAPHLTRSEVPVLICLRQESTISYISHGIE